MNMATPETEKLIANYMRDHSMPDAIELAERISCAEQLVLEHGTSGGTLLGKEHIDTIVAALRDITRLRALLGRAESVIKGHHGVGGGAQRMSVLDEIKKELGE